MPGKRLRSWMWMSVLAGAALVIELLLGDWSGRGQGQEAQHSQAALGVAKSRPLASPSTTCRGCHDQDRTNSYRPEELAALTSRMTESPIYERADKHQIAFARLTNERSRNMVKLLGLQNKDATKVDACLRCHALPEVNGVRTSATVLSEGVTCVTCHGPYREWFLEHQQAAALSGLERPVNRPKDAAKDWFDLTRKEKEDLKGMTDLWDPVRRTEICVSCHIGNTNEKKLVTHAMYAAGHPPLPSFEPASFSDMEPRHWQYLGEKTKAQRDRLRPFHESNLEAAELVAVSGPIMLRESMRFFAEEGKRKGGDDRTAPGWPDFARYDCRACHHELKSELKDAPRDEPFVPGRPSEPKWVHALARIGITGLTATPDDARNQRACYELLVERLREAMSAEPFGSGAGVAQAAAELGAWADELVKGRPSSGVDKERAWILLVQVCDEATARGLDYDSARQLAWAFRAIYHDLIPDAKKTERNPDIERILIQLETALFLNLGSAQEKTAIEDSLAKRLGQAALFDRAATAALFAGLKPFVVPH
jgi:hypothetical protein